MIPTPTKRRMIDIGHKCNLRCQMCYNMHEVDSGKAKWEPVEKMKDQIRQAKSKGDNYIEATGGEPTLYPHITELIEYAASLDMKFSIITNGITGKNQTEKILKSEIDDWLISVHDDSMLLPCYKEFNARQMQERFLKQVREFNKNKDDLPYRFNFCMTQQNQKNIIKTAKWAAKWKPRIFNWINFNPHIGWKSDVEGTKKVIGDLDVIEEQLTKAIPILLDAGCGVNVRYFPMCRLPEPFRMHVCNDAHVMFDPYEWSNYCDGQKSFKSYLAAGEKMSSGVEWKGQPCLQCNLKFICGGINSAFYCASGMEGIEAVKDDNVIRDDIYHYRRNNHACLLDRSGEKKEFCIATVVDESESAYIPIFLQCAHKAYPDYDIKVFARYGDHGDLKAICDESIGLGFYDNQVIDIHGETEHYGQGKNITDVLQFIEFEEHLKDYKHILFVDVKKMFFESGDLLGDLKAMVPKGGFFYNPVTKNENSTIFSREHFITQYWWGKVKNTIPEIVEFIKEKSSSINLLSEMLFEFFPKIGHSSEWSKSEGSIVNCHSFELLSHSTNEATIKKFHDDESIFSVITKCAALSKEILKGQTNLSRLYKKITDRPVEISGNKAQPNGKILHHEGELLVFTMCNKDYQWYAPLFLRSLQLSYPEAQAKVIVFLNNGEEIDPKVSSMCSECDNGSVENFNYTDIEPTGWNTAAMRFLIHPMEETTFDFTLITDCDMLIHPSNTSIVDQHMHHLSKDGTRCYENWISQKRGEEIRMPGVHFVTNGWWEATSSTRVNELKKLSGCNANEYCYDEFMLGRIVVNSGLPLPPMYGNKLWRNNGVHLGDWRLNMIRKFKARPDVHHLMHIKTLLDDNVFMNMAAECKKHIDYLGKMLDKWPDYFK